MMLGTYQHQDWQPGNCEIDLARDIWNRAFPATHPRIAGLDHYGESRTARGLSSDYLDYFDLPAGSLGLAMGDVAGQGVSGLLLTSTLRSIARAHIHDQKGSLALWAASIDEIFYQLCPDDFYATMFL